MRRSVRTTRVRLALACVRAAFLGRRAVLAYLLDYLCSRSGPAVQTVDCGVFGASMEASDAAADGRRDGLAPSRLGEAG